MYLLHLLHLCDPALPIGGFSHSAALETYVQEGIVTDKKTATAFISRQLSENLFYTDVAILSLVFDAANDDNVQEILELDHLCTAVKLPVEIRLASNKLGLRLLKIFEGNSFASFMKYKKAVKQQDAFGHYCIVFALVARAMNIKKKEAIIAFYYNASTGFMTNSVKLVPLGQQEGQQILMSLFPLIEELAQRSLHPNKELIGFCCSGFDIRSMQHEQLYSRLYMS